LNEHMSKVYEYKNAKHHTSPTTGVLVMAGIAP
jgi:hypothetical protein